MGRPPLEPGCHQQLNVSFSGDLQPSRAGFPGGDEPGKCSKYTKAVKFSVNLKCVGLKRRSLKQHKNADVYTEMCIACFHKKNNPTLTVRLYNSTQQREWQQKWSKTSTHPQANLRRRRKWHQHPAAEIKPVTVTVPVLTRMPCFHLRQKKHRGKTRKVNVSVLELTHTVHRVLSEGSR